jgi:hypothetical protein
VRIGEKAVSSGVEHVSHGVDRLVQASIDRLAPVRRAREEMSNLRTRLEQLEASLADLETAPAPAGTATAAANEIHPENGPVRKMGAAVEEAKK